MKCPSCGFENKSGRKFCGNCGSPLQNTCPNCGTLNAPGAKFCTRCGRAIGAAPPAKAAAVQPVVIVKQGVPGWLWALVGLLVVGIAIGGLRLVGVFPSSQPYQAHPSTLPAVPPTLAFLKMPTALASEEIYCPQSGGVILYWNAGYDCQSESNDPGYRYRVGDGAQDLDTGQFDNQASAIYIPAGWSVRLYENAGQQGQSVCFHSPVSNFMDRGNFPGGNVPINDNVSSMKVFADGTCGEDLAAGAEPAPWPKDEPPLHPPAAGNADGAVVPPAAENENEDLVCFTYYSCDCVPRQLLDVLPAPNGDRGWGGIPIVADDTSVAFGKKYFDRVEKTNSSLWVRFKPGFEELYKALQDAGMFIGFDAYGTEPPQEARPTCEPDENGLLVCDWVFPPVGDRILQWDIHIYKETPAGEAACAQIIFTQEEEDRIFNLDQPAAAPQCPNPHKPQVCGDLCCNKDDICELRNGNWRCDKPASSPSCSSSLGAAACSAAGGTWDAWSGSCSCP